MKTHRDKRVECRVPMELWRDMHDIAKEQNLTTAKAVRLIFETGVYSFSSKAKPKQDAKPEDTRP